MTWNVINQTFDLTRLLKPQNMVSKGTNPWTSHRFEGLGVGKLEPKYCKFHSKKIQWNLSGQLGVRCWHWTKLGCLQEPSSNFPCPPCVVVPWHMVGKGTDPWTLHRFLGLGVGKLEPEYCRFHKEIISMELGLLVRCWHWIELRYLQKSDSSSKESRFQHASIAPRHGGTRHALEDLRIDVFGTS